MFASLSAENRVRSRLQELGISAVFLAALAQIPVTRLNFAFKNLKPLSPEDGETLLALTSKLIELRDAFRPLTLSLSDPEEVRALLKHMELKGTTPADVRGIVGAVFKESQ